MSGPTTSILGRRFRRWCECRRADPSRPGHSRRRRGRRSGSPARADGSAGRRGPRGLSSRGRNGTPRHIGGRRRRTPPPLNQRRGTGRRGRVRPSARPRRRRARSRAARDRTPAGGPDSPSTVAKSRTARRDGRRTPTTPCCRSPAGILHARRRRARQSEPGVFVCWAGATRQDHDPLGRPCREAAPSVPSC